MLLDFTMKEVGLELVMYQVEQHIGYDMFLKLLEVDVFRFLKWQIWIPNCTYRKRGLVKRKKCLSRLSNNSTIAFKSSYIDLCIDKFQFKKHNVFVFQVWKTSSLLVQKITD